MSFMNEEIKENLTENVNIDDALSMFGLADYELTSQNINDRYNILVNDEHADKTMKKIYDEIKTFLLEKADEPLYSFKTSIHNMSEALIAYNKKMDDLRAEHQKLIAKLQEMDEFTKALIEEKVMIEANENLQTLKKNKMALITKKANMQITLNDIFQKMNNGNLATADFEKLNNEYNVTNNELANINKEIENINKKISVKEKNIQTDNKPTLMKPPVFFQNVDMNAAAKANANDEIIVEPVETLEPLDQPLASVATKQDEKVIKPVEKTVEPVEKTVEPVEKTVEPVESMFTQPAPQSSQPVTEKNNNLTNDDDIFKPFTYDYSQFKDVKPVDFNNNDMQPDKPVTITPDEEVFNQPAPIENVTPENTETVDQSKQTEEPQKDIFKELKATGIQATKNFINNLKNTVSGFNFQKNINKVLNTPKTFMDKLSLKVATAKANKKIKDLYEDLENRYQRMYFDYYRIEALKKMTDEALSKDNVPQAEVYKKLIDKLYFNKANMVDAIRKYEDQLNSYDNIKPGIKDKLVNQIILSLPSYNLDDFNNKTSAIDDAQLNAELTSVESDATKNNENIAAFDSFNQKIQLIRNKSLVLADQAESKTL